MISQLGWRITAPVVLFTACLVWTPAGADCDTAAPVLTGFSFTPNSINTTSASQTVTCNMTLTDALSGVSSATCTFTSPDFAHRQSCTANAPTVGTPQNGTWSCTLTFPRYSPSGTWNADDAGGASLPGVSARDAVGNTASVNPADQAFPSALTVTSDPDTVAPALTTFTVPPGAVNVSAASQTVTCNMTLTDAKSGVAFASCQLSAPSGSSSQTVSCGSAAPSSGTRNSGVFSCVATIPRYADAGNWTSQVAAIDQVGNYATFAPAAGVAVTASPEDVVAPSLSNFDFNPKTISVGASSKSVLCTMVVADALAGVDTATCSFNIFTFVPPTDIVTQQQSCTASAPVTGTRNSGTFQCSVIFPRYSAPGLWSSSVSLTDLTGNTASYAQALQENVDCTAGDAETSCRFAADKNTLSWDAVAGSTQYDVYRGPLTNFVDVNADDVPDGGYGTCQNSRDGNITDTTFLDTDVPTVAQKGFFYLVGYKTAGVEKGLGANSFGTPRTEAATCP
jgi:hypothetical protein